MDNWAGIRSDYYKKPDKPKRSFIDRHGLPPLGDIVLGLWFGAVFVFLFWAFFWILQPRDYNVDGTTKPDYPYFQRR
jgi:hypothetical protein